MKSLGVWGWWLGNCDEHFNIFFNILYIKLLLVKIRLIDNQNNLYLQLYSECKEVVSLKIFLKLVGECLTTG